MVWQNTSNEAIFIIKMDMKPGEKKKQTIQTDTKLTSIYFLMCPNGTPVT